MNRNSISMSHNFTRQTASFRRIRTMTMISLLAAVAFVFAFFEFPVPLSPHLPEWIFRIFLLWWVRWHWGLGQAFW